MTTTNIDKVKCEGCGDKYPVDELGKGTDNKLYCADCFSERYFICEGCRNVEELDEHYRGLDSCLYCGECYYDRYSTCDGCGTTCESDNIYYHERQDRSYCESCFPEDDNRFFSAKREYPLNGNERKFFGVELECIKEGEKSLNGHSKSKYWKCVEDGSLNSGGVEYVSPKLSYDPRGLKELKSFLGLLNDTEHEIDATCGLHIHFSVNKLQINLDNEAKTLKNFKKLWLGYMQAERILFSMQPSSRGSNQYCRKLTRDYELDTVANKQNTFKLLSYYYSQAIKGKEDNNFKHKYPDNGSKRYYFVNLHSIFFRGSLEVRLHSGSLNYEKIVAWVRLNRKFIDYLLKSSTRVQDVKNLSVADFFKIIGKDLGKYVIERADKFNPSEVSYLNTGYMAAWGEC